MAVLVVHQGIFRLINPLLYKSLHGDRLLMVITVKTVWLEIKRVSVVAVFRLNYVTTLTVLSGNCSDEHLCSPGGGHSRLLRSAVTGDTVKLYRVTETCLFCVIVHLQQCSVLLRRG